MGKRIYVRSGGAWVDVTTAIGTNSFVTEVVAGSGLTGGSVGGAATVDIGSGNGITVNSNNIQIDTSVVATLNDAQTLSSKTISSAVLTGDTTINAQGDLRFADADSTHYVAVQAPSTIATNYTLTLPTTAGSSNQVLQTNGSGVLSWASGGSGDVTGPASSVDNTIARYNLATGKVIQGSGVIITDSDVLALPTAVATRDVVLTSSTTVDMSASDYFEIQTPTITHVGNTTLDLGSSTSGNITLPTMVTGDLCIVCISSDGGTTLTTGSTGWTATTAVVGTDAYLRVYSKIMGATPDTTFNITGVSTATVAHARAYRGAAGVDNAQTATNTLGMPDAPAAATSFPGSTVVIFGGLDDDAGIASSAPGQFSDYLVTESSATKTTLYSAHRFNITGMIDPVAFSGSGTDAWSAATVVISPASYGTLTFSNVPNVAISGYTGNANVMSKMFLVTGSGRMGWPASVTWIEGIAPQTTPYLATLTTLNGGGDWYGSHASQR